MTPKSQKPANQQSWRQSLYAGDIYLLPEIAPATALVERVSQLLHQEFATDDIFSLHQTCSEEAFFASMKTIRKQLFEGELFIALLKALLIAWGFRPNEVAFEPLRLRAIRPMGHLNPRAKAVYYPHRDTWYGHGQSVIVGWIPLHNQLAEQTFEVFPEYFNRAVPNNSEIFDYEQWRRDTADKRTGWQNPNTGLVAQYPQATGGVDVGQRLGFGCKKAQSLFFSGAHFHQTLKQAGDTCRFSVDYRLVQLEDAKRNIGAPNADNRSRGSAVIDYIPL